MATKPKTPVSPQTALVQAEIAARVLAQRHLIPFTKRFNPKYSDGWVHRDICRRLERFSKEVAEGKSPRLMLLMPPRHGKSELASRSFPAWHLGHHPDHEFIACSYNIDLARSFSRKVKQIIEDPTYASVFPATKLDPDNASNEAWGLFNERGGYVAAGVGGGITGRGAHCLHPQSKVLTVDGSLDIVHLYHLKSIPDVATPMGPKRVLAATKRPAPQMYVLRFASGAVLRATAEHPIYLPDQGRYATVGELYGQAQNHGVLDLRVVRHGVRASAGRLQQGVAEGAHGLLLQSGVQSGTPRGEERQTVRDMRCPGEVGSEPQREILLSGVPTCTAKNALQDLPSVQRGVSAEAFKAGLLRGGLRGYGACDPYAWGEELELPNGGRIRVLVRPDEAADSGARQRVCGVRSDTGSALSPYRRGEEQQRPGEPGDALRRAPHGASQVCYDTLSVVEPDSECPDFVYDLQVEDAGCFFAEEILVGNCLVIDDPVKNAEEADSSDNREKIWEWYLSTAYSRLAPGGGVLIIQTWWHDDDLAGRLQTLMKTGSDDEYIDQFEVIKYPAIAEADEYLNTASDQLEYDVPPELASSPQYTLLRRKGEPLHPERYDLNKLLRIKAQNNGGRWWSALYQQNPVPNDGGYFTKDQFRQQPAPSKEKCNILIAWDFAISEKKQNDYTVGTVGLQDDDDMLHIVDQLRFKSADAFFIVEAILNLALKWYSSANPAMVIGFEDGQIYRAIESLLKKRMKERQFYPSTVVLKPITDKLARGRVLQGRMQQGMVSFASNAPWFDSLKTEMLRFPAGVHDDQVDSASWMAQLAVGKAAPAKPRSSTPRSWRDKLNSYGQGSTTHMVA